jgi:hypothetical protein
MKTPVVHKVYARIRERQDLPAKAHEIGLTPRQRAALALYLERRAAAVARYKDPEFYASEEYQEHSRRVTRWESRQNAMRFAALIVGGLAGIAVVSLVLPLVIGEAGAALVAMIICAVALRTRHSGCPCGCGGH